VFFCGIVSHAALFVHVDDVRNTENIVTMTACCKVAVALQHSGTGRGKDVNCAEVEVCVECVGELFARGDRPVGPQCRAQPAATDMRRLTTGIRSE
jgi:hypothetical protein